MYRQWGAVESSKPLPFVDLTLVSAFVFKNSISVTTTLVGYRNVGRKVICRYYDCNRKEIPNSAFESLIFPVAVVDCARRAHAKHISLFLTDQPAIKSIQPIPLTFRAFDEPLNEFGVCLGNLYDNNGAKWLEIIESVENHRILGATMFYFVNVKATMYDNRVFEYYDKLGLSETIHIPMIHRFNYEFQELMQNECYYRSRQHSKWVLSLNLDEHLIFDRKHSFLQFLRVQSPKIGEVAFAVSQMARNANTMEKYGNNQTKLEENLRFLKLNETSEREWTVPRSLFNSNRIHPVFYNFAYLREPDTKVLRVLPNIGYVRHYQKIDANTSLQNNTKNFYNEPFDQKFGEELKRKVILTVNSIYQEVEKRCEDVTATNKKLGDLKKNGESCVWKNGTRIN